MRHTETLRQDLSSSLFNKLLSQPDCVQFMFCVLNSLKLRGSEFESIDRNWLNQNLDAVSGKLLLLKGSLERESLKPRAATCSLTEEQKMRRE